MIIRLFFLLFTLPIILNAQPYPAKPTNYVTDASNTLTSEQQTKLNEKLHDFEIKSSNQIFIYIASSLNGNDLDALSQEIFHNWKIGGQKNDNGVLIAIFINEHKFRVQTGYGLEEKLPDLLTKKIQDETMRPYFKTGDYYTGLDKGIDKLIYYSANAYDPKVLETETDFAGLLGGYIANAILLIIFVLLLFRKNPKKERTASAKTILLTVAILVSLIACIGSMVVFFMLFLVIKFPSGQGGSSSGSSGSNFWSSSSDSSYSSGSDYSSSSSSSDFSGGGGGDSGGGGSSSDW